MIGAETDAENRPVWTKSENTMKSGGWWGVWLCCAADWRITRGFNRVEVSSCLPCWVGVSTHCWSLSICQVSFNQATCFFLFLSLYLFFQSVSLSSSAICPLTVTGDPLQRVHQICSPRHLVTSWAKYSLNCGFIVLLYSGAQVVYWVSLASVVLTNFTSLFKWSCWGKLHPSGTPGSIKQTIKYLFNTLLIYLSLVNLESYFFKLSQHQHRDIWDRLYGMKPNTKLILSQ